MSTSPRGEDVSLTRVATIGLITLIPHAAYINPAEVGMAAPEKESLNSVKIQAVTGTRRILKSANKSLHYPAFDTRDDFYHALLSGLPDAILVVDSKGQICWSNKQATRLFGYDQHEFTALSIEVLFPEGDVQSIFKRGDVGTAASEKRPPLIGLNGRHKDRERFLADIRVAPLQTLSGGFYLHHPRHHHAPKNEAEG